MAALDHLKLFLEFEPIVKLACWNEDCRFNLINAANLAGEGMVACNLKQITIGKDGKCLNYRSIKVRHED